MTVNVGQLVLLFGAGLLLGGAYFGGLWLTLRRLPRWRHPFLLMGLSLFVRLAVLLGVGGWLWRSSDLPPLLTVLLLSGGVWLSRLLLTARLLATVEPASVRSAAHM